MANFARSNASSVAASCANARTILITTRPLQPGNRWSAVRGDHAVSSSNAAVVPHRDAAVVVAAHASRGLPLRKAEAGARAAEDAGRGKEGVERRRSRVESQRLDAGSRARSRIPLRGCGDFSREYLPLDGRPPITHAQPSCVRPSTFDFDSPLRVLPVKRDRLFDVGVNALMHGAGARGIFECLALRVR